VDADPEGHVRISAVLHTLAEQGINRLLVEGGVTVASAFLKEGFADRLEIFTAPMTLGNAGRHGTGALALRNLNEAPNFMRVSCRSFGDDRLESYEARS
jgi:diaminohydroxyphosphoribosylaminopyrimidine deaminase/5-amino-6-(5-phosphoribosylamino)uracil reductase